MMDCSARASVAVLATLVVLLSGCHALDANDRCGDLSKALYSARRLGARDRIEAAVTSEFVSQESRDALVSAIVDRDAMSGVPRSYQRYVTNTQFESDIPENWYSVRNGYNLQTANGNTWEEVFCRIDASGERGSIVGLKFGPVPRK